MAPWRWSRAYAGNIADAIVLAVTDDRAAGRVYNVAEPVAHDAGGVARAPSADDRRLVGAIVAGGTTNRCRRTCASNNNYAQHIDGDSSRIRSELGYVERVCS